LDIAVVNKAVRKHWVSHKHLRLYDVEHTYKIIYFKFTHIQAMSVIYFTQIIRSSSVAVD